MPSLPGARPRASAPVRNPQSGERALRASPLERSFLQPAWRARAQHGRQPEARVVREQGRYLPACVEDHRDADDGCAESRPSTEDPTRRWTGPSPSSVGRAGVRTRQDARAHPAGQAGEAPVHRDVARSNAARLLVPTAARSGPARDPSVLARQQSALTSWLPAVRYPGQIRTDVDAPADQPRARARLIKTIDRKQVKAGPYPAAATMTNKRKECPQPRLTAPTGSLRYHQDFPHMPAPRKRGRYPRRAPPHADAQV